MSGIVENAIVALAALSLARRFLPSRGGSKAACSTSCGKCEHSVAPRPPSQAVTVDWHRIDSKAQRPRR